MRPPHHRDGGFQNNDPGFEPKRLTDVLRWRLDAMRQGLPPRPSSPHPDHGGRPRLHPGQRRPGPETAVTWIGHATVLAQPGGDLSLLTDPIFSERASPLSFIGPKREQAARRGPARPAPHRPRAGLAQPLRPPRPAQLPRRSPRSLVAARSSSCRWALGAWFRPRAWRVWWSWTGGNHRSCGRAGVSHAAARPPLVRRA